MYALAFLAAVLFTSIGRAWAFLSSFKFALSRHEDIFLRVYRWCILHGWAVEVEPNDMGILGSQWMYLLKKGSRHAQWVDESKLSIKMNWADFLEFMYSVNKEFD
jgi:hypothetical protein